jgi:hypothetical protein
MILIMPSQKQIRLTTQEIIHIKNIFIKHFGNTDHLWIFGSRVNPKQKGGDLDLYIESNNNSMKQILDQKIKFLVELKQVIGNQKIDVIINAKYLNHSLAIYDEARNTGIMLV